MFGTHPWFLPKIGRKILGSWNNLGSTDEYRPAEGIAFGEMRAENGERIALKSANISGVVDGLLFSSRVSQLYRNETEGNLEIVYTFPIAWDSALLGLKARIGEKCLEGKVAEKAEAQKTYDKALKDGDAAIMVQESSAGLYTVRLGNIKPGEEVEIAIHCAQLLNFEQNRVRLCIPTVIGERYGDAHGAGALSAGESAAVDANARYALGVEITVYGELAKGAISSPTHAIELEAKNGKTMITMEKGARLDRDFVILFKGAGVASHASYIKMDSGWMAVASYAPNFGEDNKTKLCLKTLIDCSGSMRGESIAQAANGLARIIDELQEGDYFSFARFGSDVVEVTKGIVPCNEAFKSGMKEVVKATDADMGGTEMAKALGVVLNQEAHGPASELPGAVLLITDGDVWDLDAIERLARESGQRIYVIGVGSAPAEGPLMKLAKASGGSCEFVTPNENMAETMVRTFRRMRSSLASAIKMDWGQEPVWQSKVPGNIYSGETTHLFALLAQEPQDAPVLGWKAEGKEFSEKASVFEESVDEDLARVGGWRRMQETEQKDEKLALALQYQLISPLTNLILVDVREEKAIGKLAVQHAPQMQAHGHGMNVAAAHAALGFFAGSSLLEGDVPAFLRMSEDGSTRGMMRKASKSRRRPDLVAEEAFDPCPRTGVKLPEHIDKAALTSKVLELWQADKTMPEDEFLRLLEQEPALAQLKEAIAAIARSLTLEAGLVWRAYLRWLLMVNGEEAGQIFKIKGLNKIETEKLLEAFENFLKA